MAVKLEEALKKQLSAVVEIAPNPDVPMVKEAVANGFYRRQSLLNVQSSLLRYFPNLAEFPRKLTITGVYNPEVFQTLLERVSEQGYYDMIKRAVWNDDLSIIDPTARDTSLKKPLTGELTPPRREPPPPSSEPLPLPRNIQRAETTTPQSTARTPRRAQQTEETQAEETPQTTQPSQQAQQPQSQTPPPENQPGPRPEQPEENQDQNNQAQPQQQQQQGPQQQQGLRDRFRRKKPKRILPGESQKTAATAPKNPFGWRDALRRGQNLANRLGYNRLGNVLGRLAQPEKLLGNLARGGLRAGANGLTQGTQALARVGGQAAAGVGRGIASGVAALVGAIGLTGLIIIGIILLISALFIFLWWYDNLIGNSDCDKSTGTMSVEKRLGGRSLGGDAVNNGDKIEFVIIVKYDLACRTRTLKQVEVTDSIPAGLEYVKDSARSGFYNTTQPGAQGVYNDSSRTLTWTFEDFPMSNPVYIFFTVEPTQKTDGSWSVQDTWVINEASVRYTGSGGSLIGGSAGGNTTGPGGTPVDYKAQDALVAATVKGQERNTHILGDRTSFIETVARNGLSERMDQKKDQLGKIYDASDKYGINPLIVLATWGTETGFATSGTALSCSDTPDPTVSTGFDQQVYCSARTFAKFMDDFNAGKTTIDVCADKYCRVKTGEVCTYDNQLLYSMDWYGPICHFHDGNENYRPNFVKFYNKFGGFQ